MMRRWDSDIGLVCGGAFILLTLWARSGSYLPGEQAELQWVVTHRLSFLDPPLLVFSALGSLNIVLPLWLTLMLALTILRRWLALLQIGFVPFCYPLYALIKLLIGRPAPTPTAFARLNDLPLGYHLEGLLQSKVQALPSPTPGAVVPSPVVTQPPIVGQSLTQLIEIGYVSGHALVALVFYGTLALLIWNSGASALWRGLGSAAGAALALLPGLARLYMGVHFPSDVLGAWLLGIVIVILLSCLPGIVTRRVARNPR